MNIVAAILVLFAALLVGVVSYTFVPVIQGEEEEEPLPKGKDLLVMTKKTLRQMHRKQYLFLVVTALICAVATFYLAGAEKNPMELFRYCAVELTLLAIMIIDGKTYRIPNIVLFILLGVSTLLTVAEVFAGQRVWKDALLTSGLGLIACIALFYLMARLTKDGIGMGDVKLIAVMGWTIGLSLTLTAVFVSLIFCTIAAVLLLITKRKTVKDAIPFGPFLFWGYMAVLFIVSIF